MMELTNVVIVPSIRAQYMRKLLEEAGIWDRNRRLRKLPKGQVAIPITTESLECLELTEGGGEACHPYSVTRMEMPVSKAGALVAPALALRQSVRDILRGAMDEDQISKLTKEIPQHWERHGDLLLLPASSFQSSVWMQVPGVWKCVAKSLTCHRVAKQCKVSADGFRTPRVSLLLGDHGLVEQVDNGIRYSYDVTKCMFSAGNICEKLRVATFPCHGETVLDLYAGIGYFTLPYLVHAGAAHVHACEWNPDAVKALERNLFLNGVADRCTVHPGDNRQLQLFSKVDRVNLGLIPSSEASWGVACASLCSDKGGILHIHGNVASKVNPASTSAQEQCCEVGSWQENDAAEIRTHLMSVTDPPPPEGVVNSDTEAGCDGENLSLSALGRDCDGNVSMDANTVGNIGNLEKKSSSNELPTSLGVSRLRLSEVSGSVVAGIAVVHEEDRQGDAMSCNPNAHHSSVLPSQGLNLALGSSASLLSSHLPATNLSESNASQEDPEADGKLHAEGDSLQDGMATTWRDSGRLWARSVASRIRRILEGCHGGQWMTQVMHVEHVKSYAPHVHHLVIDLECRPVMGSLQNGQPGPRS